jgi:hypothetical protein
LSEAAGTPRTSARSIWDLARLSTALAFCSICRATNGSESDRACQTTAPNAATLASSAAEIKAMRSIGRMASGGGDCASDSKRASHVSREVWRARARVSHVAIKTLNAIANKTVASRAGIHSGAMARQTPSRSVWRSYTSQIAAAG